MKISMKWLAPMAVGLLATFGSAPAWAAPAYSQNAVGFSKCSIPGSLTVPTFCMVNNPFNGPNNLLSTVLPSVPDGSQLYFFRNGAFEIRTYAGGWSQNNTWSPGEGAWFENPPGSLTPTVLTFIGEVPQGALSVPIPAGYSICSFPGWGMARNPLGGITTALGLIPSNGDQLYRWDCNVGTWNIYTYLGVWGAEPTPNLCEAFWIANNSGGPYSWNATVNVHNTGDATTLPPISSYAMVGGAYQVTFPTTLGNTYVVEGTSWLAPPASTPWAAISGPLPGTGASLTFTDPAAALPSLATRIYRVRRN